MEDTVERKVQNEEPPLATRSPMCTNYQMTAHLDWAEVPTEDANKCMTEARLYLHFCVIFGAHRAARIYLRHGQLLVANSWRELCVVRSVSAKGVLTTKGHTCKFGMLEIDQDGPGLALKPKAFLTNWVCIAEVVEQFCQQGHRHIKFEGSHRTRDAQIHPPDLCRAICKGLMDQQIPDKAGPSSIASRGAMCREDIGEGCNKRRRSARMRGVGASMAPDG